MLRPTERDSDCETPMLRPTERDSDCETPMLRLWASEAPSEKDSDTPRVRPEERELEMPTELVAEREEMVDPPRDSPQETP